MKELDKLNTQFIKSKEKIAKIFKDKHSPENKDKRLTPGQYLTEKFPVLDLGIQPDFNPKTWKLEVTGEVESKTFTYEDILKMPKTNITKDFTCLSSGTLIFTDKQPKKIEDIKIGDRIIGKDGKPHKVKNLFSKEYNGKLIKIKSGYLPETTVTPDHKIFVIRAHPGVGKSKSRRRKLTFANDPIPIWIEASKVHKGDYVFFPKYNYFKKFKNLNCNGHKIKIDKKLAYILGWYVSDGSKGSSGDRVVAFSLNECQKKEGQKLKENLELIFGAKVSIYERGKANYITVTSSKVDLLAKFLKNLCGKSAEFKYIPDFILNSDLEILREFLIGLLEGDGYCPWKIKNHRSKNSRENFIDITTLSTSLAYQMIMAFSKIGVPAYLVNHPGSVRDAYSVRVHSFEQIIKLLPEEIEKIKIKINRNRYWENEKGFYYPINKIEEIPYSGKVYDITAEGFTMLSPFVTLDCVTHWTKLDVKWSGVLWKDFIKYLNIKPNVKAVMFYGADGYSTNDIIEDLDNAMLAYELEGKPIPREHGWPLRIIIPHLYAWKGSKFLNKIEFMKENRPGFWEVRGYHIRGDIYKEERYS